MLSVLHIRRCMTITISIKKNHEDTDLKQLKSSILLMKLMYTTEGSTIPLASIQILLIICFELK